MRRFLIALFLIIPSLAVLSLYLPVLDLALTGDDYQWLQLAHEAALRPQMLFSDLDTFFRPTNTWSMIVERYVWDDYAGGFHGTNLALHVIATILIVLAARRFGLSWLAASLIAMLWGCSHLSSEPAIRVASRHEDFLLIGWLGMMLAWPEKNERWTAVRTIAVFCSVLLALFSKETWIVTPGFALALDIAFRQLPFRRSLLHCAYWISFSALYALFHFLVFHSTRDYFNMTASTLAKIPHQISAFFFFETLIPMNFSWSWKGVLALGLVLTVMLFALKWKSRAGVMGSTLLVLPMLPTLFVPYLPTRYTAIPFAGFLLLLIAFFESFIKALKPHIRTLGLVVMLILAAAPFVVEIYMVRAELTDAAAVSAAHRKLLTEAGRIAGEFPLDRPVLVIRRENDNPLRDIARTARGLPKIYYVRHADPYGLIDTAALFEWVLHQDRVLIRRYDDWEERFQQTAGAVMMHRRGGFEWISARAPDIADVAHHWSMQGFPIRLIQAEMVSSSQ